MTYVGESNQHTYIYTNTYIFSKHRNILSLSSPEKPPSPHSLIRNEEKHGAMAHI